MHYLLDTSALIFYYDTDENFENFRKEINDNKNVIHILEICNPEVISIFYKKHFAEKNKLKQITFEEAKDLCNEFINDIKSKMKFLIHPVMARDIIGTDKVWAVAEKVYNDKLKKSGKDFIDSTDALIIALAVNLSQIKGIKDNFILITNDTHLYMTAKELKINSKTPSEF